MPENISVLCRFLLNFIQAFFVFTLIHQPKLLHIVVWVLIPAAANTGLGIPLYRYGEISKKHACYLLKMIVLQEKSGGKAL